MHKVIVLCKEVPLLPVIILAAIPLALWPETCQFWTITNGFAPGIGEWIIILITLYTVIESIRGMIDDLKHGHVGVDLLAVVALISTVCVQQYWATWAVVLMVASGDAIETYAQAKARGSLTALMEAAPQQAHVVEHEASDGTNADGAADMSERAADEYANSHFKTVDVSDVKIGDEVIVLPGETVPVDGDLISSAATLDLSNLNGEPVPRTVFAGANIMSGSINGAAAIRIRATHVAADSQYQHILKLVQSAQESRPAVVRTADIMAVPFTVISFAIAIIAWIASGTPLRFAQVLVLATPCPLLIAAPVAYVAGTGRLAKASILIKTQEVLENLGRVSHVFFDKTGTLTVKQPRVVRVDKAKHYECDGHEECPLSVDEILMLAGTVESYSVHILAKGITQAGGEAREKLQRAASSRTTPNADEAGAVDSTEGDVPAYMKPIVADIVEESGKGVSGTVNGHRVYVGRYAYVTSSEAGFMHTTPNAPSRKTLSREHADVSSDISSHFSALEPDEMAAYVSIDGNLAARIVLRDVPRVDAKKTVQELHELGVKDITMLTGDKKASAMIIANEVGITDVHYELFPEDKVNCVKDATEAVDSAPESWWSRVMSKLLGEPLHPHVTMMVGDGVNDAPVLASANIGMAMTDGTSTAASESAEVVIMNDDIISVPRAIKIARQTKRVMLQAVLMGLGLAIVAMICAAFNLIPVVIGAFLQECIDVVSILWALTAMFDRK